MSDTIKKGFGFLGIHVLGIFLTFVAAGLFSFITNLFVFSIMSSLIYIGTLYSYSWRYGKIDSKPYNNTKPSIILPLKYSIIPSVVPAFLMLAKPWNSIGLLTKFWFFMFLGFLPEGTNVNVLQILLCSMVLPFSVTLGYFFGGKNYSISEQYEKRRLQKILAKKERFQKERKLRMNLSKGKDNQT